MSLHKAIRTRDDNIVLGVKVEACGLGGAVGRYFITDLTAAVSEAGYMSFSNTRA